MGNVLWVGLGGFIGSVLRYLLGVAVHEWVDREFFPAGTFAVNLIGCLAIGVVTRLAELRGTVTSEVHVFMVVGILGGFTTFSSFGNETVALWRTGRSALAVLNVVGQVVLGLGSVCIGRWLGQWWQS